MEPHDVERMLTQLVELATSQQRFNEQQTQFNEQQTQFNQRVTAAIERLEVTLTAIKDLLERPNGH